MKTRICYVPVAIILILLFTTPGCRQNSDENLYIAKYNGIFTTPPRVVPTLFTTDGAIAGNGDVGIVYAGNPEKQRFYFSKNDFWKSKPGYPDGAINLVGGLDISADSLVGASYYAIQRIANGTIQASFKKNDLEYKLSTWVAASDNLVIIELESAGTPIKINLDLWPKTCNGSIIETGQEGNVYWISRKFDTPDLEWPTAIAAAMKIIGAKDKTFELKPSQKVQIVVSFCANHDREDYFETTVQKAKSVTAASLKQLRSAQENWWADFWEDYLKFENNRYVVYNDNFFEVGPWLGKDWKKNFGDINPTLTLGMLKMFFKDIIDVSDFLNRDLNRHEKWQHILQNLSKIPTVEYGGMTRIPGAKGGSGSGTNYKRGYSTGFIGYWGMHGLIWPSDAFGLKRNPDFARLIRDEISTWNDDIWMNAMINTIFTVAVRSGISPEFILKKLSERIEKFSYPNLCIPYGGGGIETFSGVPSCINEMLLQGYEGMIRVFPAWPDDKNAKFENLRTYGAFLVSSEKSDGKVKYLKLKSGKGRPCTLENPWGKARVLLERNWKKGETLSGDLLRFNTEENEQILITPLI